MEDITLEKIDLIRQRTGLGYAAAKEVLEKNNGDVVETLIYVEKNQKSFGQNITETTNDLIETIKDIIKKGNVTRIKVKKDERVLIDIPVNAGIAAGALSLFYPPLLVIGAATAVVSKLVIEVERPDGRVEVINDIVKQQYENAKDAAEDVMNKASEKVNNVKEEVKKKANEFTGNNSNGQNCTNNNDNNNTDINQ